MSVIHILSSTDRPGSNAMKVSTYVERILSRHATTKLFSLCDFPVKDVHGGPYGDIPESVQSFNNEFLKADGFLFVIPEYNGGFPGVLKLFYDYLPFPDAMEKKPVSLVGEAMGAFGALRPVEQFEQLLKYRKAYVYPERMFIQRVHKSFDQETGLNDETMQGLFESQLTNFPAFVDMIRDTESVQA